MEVNKIGKTSSMKAKLPKTKRESKYDDIINQMGELSPGESFIVTLDKGTNKRSFTETLNGRIRKVGFKPAESTKIIKRYFEEDGLDKMLISCSYI